MPLDPSGLKDDLEDLASDPPGEFAGDGSLDVSGTYAACGDAWGDAMREYASSVVPASETVDEAADTLATALATAFAAEGGAAAGMEAAFATFATTVAAGMAPEFTATAPPAPVGFAALMIPPFPATHDEGAQRFADAIHDWMTTGTAVPSAGGPTINWE